MIPAAKGRPGLRHGEGGGRPEGTARRKEPGEGQGRARSGGVGREAAVRL